MKGAFVKNPTSFEDRPYNLARWIDEPAEDANGVAVKEAGGHGFTWALAAMVVAGVACATVKYAAEPGRPPAALMPAHPAAAPQ